MCIATNYEGTVSSFYKLDNKGQIWYNNLVSLCLKGYISTGFELIFYLIGEWWNGRHGGLKIH